MDTYIIYIHTISKLVPLGTEMHVSVVIVHLFHRSIVIFHLIPHQCWWICPILSQV